ncbi:MAG TPA: hypothetical protein VFF21_06270 [Flavobacteriaceae bacterium]|nr:hypothetical protein [Flavobacteriaceae bacterium]
MRFLLLFFLVLLASSARGQEPASNYRKIKIPVRDTVILDSSGINPTYFRLTDNIGKMPHPFSYRIDFKKGRIIFSDSIQSRMDSINVEYLSYPEFLTKTYFDLDSKIIVKNSGVMDKLYTLDKRNTANAFTPFEGLQTSGSISRGITVGNNQNAVVNSQLDLQITGKLSDNVSIRASIQDANIPTQEGGYSQNLNEFDQIFIELFGENWNIRAGDIDLTNQGSYFGNFTKKVQGISLGGSINRADGSKISAFAAGALVKGVFTKSSFIGQEGNQGPYKLVGPNGEMYILVVSGSERVYVNGILLKRGESEDYVIDYNAGEIKFNPTYPITSDMRINVEYQFTDRNYTRFIGYGGANYDSDNLEIGIYGYSESDAKNQPLQQNLSEEQVEILKAAGDDKDKMFAPSAIPDTFSENKILYKKIFINDQEVFEYSNNPDDVLYNVRFTLVGENQGDYVISNLNAISRIYQYVPPVNGIPQGRYAPIIRLKPPEKLQLIGAYGKYKVTEKTKVEMEMAVSNFDQNLFSPIDNEDNVGMAGKFGFHQRLFTIKDSLEINAYGNLDVIQDKFHSIERFYNVEFDRDWNLINPFGNQIFGSIGVEAIDRKLGDLKYEFQNLNFSENYNGNRHVIASTINRNDLKVELNGSEMTSTADSLHSRFIRFNSRATYSFNKKWIGGKYQMENNKIEDQLHDSLSPVSQKFATYEIFSGIGDSTNVFVTGGFNYRVTDSVRGNQFQKMNSAYTYFIRSRMINTDNTQLSAFLNYREIKYHPIHTDNTIIDVGTPGNSREKDRSLNSRILYNQSFLENGIQLNTALETNNGVVPMQEYTYVKTDPGQGIYMWVDYNNNGIQEPDEFEIAQFPDQAEYIRVLLPNRIFLKIRQNKLSQTLTLNPHYWNDSEGFLKFLSHFYNQSSYILDRKIRRQNDGFDLNPFKDGGKDQLGLMLNFRNVLFFNRGKQHYSTSYTFLSTSSDNLLATGLQKNDLRSHQLNFNHKLKEVWLVNVKLATDSNESFSENFDNRNYHLRANEMNPKLSYLLNLQTRFDVFYALKEKKNKLGDLEQLHQQTFGFSFSYSNAEKITINGEINYVENAFKGSAYSPVAYQMLEGLQPGTNFTWRMLFQKRITQYLDASLTYFGRKSENSKAIHTGSMQLRAYF